MSENKQLAAALIAARAEFGPVVKSKLAKIKSDKGEFGYKYTNLESVFDAVDEPLSKHGILPIQCTDIDAQGKPILITKLIHAPTGECEVSRWPIVPTKADPQGYGSAITYARRYCLLAMLGIAPEDDDGQAACQPQKPAAKPAAAQQPAAKPRAQAPAAPAQAANGQANGAGQKPIALITAAQAEEVSRLCEAKGKPVSALCKRFALVTIFELPAHQFGFVMTNLAKLPNAPLPAPATGATREIGEEPQDDGEVTV